MSDVPTAEQICAYLHANGWRKGREGKAAYLMVTEGHTVRMLHNPTEHDRFQAVFDISLAEGRHPADVREAILAIPVAPVEEDAAVAESKATVAAGGFELVAMLAARRTKLGLSQRRVGFASGLGTSVCEYEAGRHAPTLPNLLAWADALGCDIAVTVRPKTERQQNPTPKP